MKKRSARELVYRRKRKVGVDLVPSVCILCRDRVSLSPQFPHHPLKEDLSGQHFTRLTVRHFFGMLGQYSYWCCLCECGGSAIAVGAKLRCGGIKSCGCLRVEWSMHHNMHGHANRGKLSPTYQTWYNMLTRCTNMQFKQWASYGGRGISVVRRWYLFANFLADMGERPDGTTLDRYPDKDGNYCPENCRWATPREQANNTRRNRILSYDGRIQTLSEWAREIGISCCGLRDRLEKLGWTTAEAVTTPVRIRKR